VTSSFGAANAQIQNNKRGRLHKNDLHYNPLFSTTSEKPFCLSERYLAKSSLTSRLSASLKQWSQKWGHSFFPSKSIPHTFFRRDLTYGPQGIWSILGALISSQVLWEKLFMRDLYQLLREKELDIVRVRQEIAALRAIIPLLEDDEGFDESSPKSHPSLHAVNRD
jgi:hypothetical protein